MCVSAAGERPSLKDWETHLTTIFPEVRLKRYMEMRGADGGPHITALTALWVGLLYDRRAPVLAPAPAPPTLGGVHEAGRPAVEGLGICLLDCCIPRACIQGDAASDQSSDGRLRMAQVLMKGGSV